MLGENDIGESPFTESDLARPKSASLQLHCESRRMLLGFWSRWITLPECRNWGGGGGILTEEQMRRRVGIS